MGSAALSAILALAGPETTIQRDIQAAAQQAAMMKCSRSELLLAAACEQSIVCSCVSESKLCDADALWSLFPIALPMSGIEQLLREGTTLGVQLK